MTTEWYAPIELLEKQPRWDGFSEEIPLAPQRACMLGLAQVSKLFPIVSKWKVEFIALQNLKAKLVDNISRSQDIWHYEITFVPENREQRRNLEQAVGDQPLTQIILLDGTVLDGMVLQPNSTRKGVPH